MSKKPRLIREYIRYVLSWVSIILDDTVQIWVVIFRCKLYKLSPTSLFLSKLDLLHWLYEVITIEKIHCKYRQPSLFADFLSVNLLIHDSKLAKNDNFLVKNGCFNSKFKIWGRKWWNVFTANYEGNLYMF